MRSRAVRVAAVLAALVIAAPVAVNAALSPRPAGFCDSFMSFLCPKSDPTPEPTVPEVPADPTDPGEQPPEETDTDPDAGTPEAPEEQLAPVETPGPAPVDDGAPIFAGTPAAMRAGGLSFTGLKGISIVSVPTVDGGSVRALKISADSITITGFSLTVRPPDHDGLVTNADTMELSGNVSVYLGSVSASSMGGAPLTLGTDTPPPLDDVAPGLLDVTMGLVGSIADSIHYTNTDQRIVAAE